MTIKDWHQHDRPREKLLQFGKANLSDAELLAIFLRVGVKGKNAVELSQDLLTNFGSLHKLLSATETEFCQAKGLGQATYVQLQAVLEMSQRYFTSKLQQNDFFEEPETVAKFLQHKLSYKTREHFGVILLNQNNSLIKFEILFSGTINQANVHIREIIKFALTNHAAAIIICHNHPSDCAQPSAADIKITAKIKQACTLMEIRLLDHIIIAGNGKWSSLSQLGKI